MKNRIQSLEMIARKLEPDPPFRKRVRDRVTQYSEKFLKDNSKAPAYRITSDKGAGLVREPFSEKPASIKDVLAMIQDYVDFPGLNPASGGHLGYIPGGGIYFASLGDYLAAVTNRYSGVFFASPGAVRMENHLVRWLSKIIGYPESAGGTLTSGGSIANLVGIVAARDAHNIGAEEVRRAAIYLTAQAHHSIDKAIRIAGLRDAKIRYINLDSSYRMIPAELEEQILADKKAGIRPFLVIASAGTTDTGAIDPLDEIAHISQKHGTWHHVDAAYGGFFLLTRYGIEKLRGIDQSDSVIIDPHKGLFLPYGLGAVLVRDSKKLQASQYYTANYMQDAALENEEISPAELSPELTRHFRGMRMWLPLKLHGLKPFRACLEEKLLLARYFYREIKKLGFETGPEPELSVVTYRYVPERGNADEFNRRLLQEIIKDGRVFISSTILDGHFTLRFACLSFRTHLETVDLLLQLLKEKTEELIK
jgi:glutamate/tyrosine decarboxylase-like PLP-dependent enzyme